MDNCRVVKKRFIIWKKKSWEIQIKMAGSCKKGYKSYAYLEIEGQREEKRREERERNI